jgi:hypothetical protein
MLVWNKSSWTFRTCKVHCFGVCDVAVVLKANPIDESCRAEECKYNCNNGQVCGGWSRNSVYVEKGYAFDPFPGLSPAVVDDQPK